MNSLSLSKERIHELATGHELPSHAETFALCNLVLLAQARISLLEKCLFEIMTTPSPAELVARLRDACIGQPAEIPWPHRFLHDAASMIEVLVKERDEAKTAHLKL